MAIAPDGLVRSRSTTTSAPGQSYRATWQYNNNSSTSFYPILALTPLTLVRVTFSITMAPTCRESDPVQRPRFTYNYRYALNQSAGWGGNYPSKLGLRGVPEDAFPNYRHRGIQRLGIRHAAAPTYPINQQQIVDNYCGFWAATPQIRR